MQVITSAVLLLPAFISCVFAHTTVSFNFLSLGETCGVKRGALGVWCDLKRTGKVEYKANVHVTGGDVDSLKLSLYWSSISDTNAATVVKEVQACLDGEKVVIKEGCTPTKIPEGHYKLTYDVDLKFDDKVSPIQRLVIEPHYEGAPGKDFMPVSRTVQAYLEESGAKSGGGEAKKTEQKEAEKTEQKEAEKTDKKEAEKTEKTEDDKTEPEKSG